MEITKTLINLGLSEVEAEAYTASLRLGGAPASSIAKEMDIKRTTIYTILKTLTRKGFVSVYSQKNKRVYHAIAPQKLPKILEKKLNSLNEIIPLLTSIKKSGSHPFGLRTIETKDELENFYNEVLDEYKNKEYYAIGNTTAWEEIDPDFFKKYRKQRATNKIKTKLLLSSDSKSINPVDKSLLREFKYLPSKYKFKSTIDIFNDKILIISPELSSLAIVIEVPVMVDVFKSIFEILWEIIE